MLPFIVPLKCQQKCAHVLCVLVGIVTQMSLDKCHDICHDIYNMARFHFHDSHDSQDTEMKLGVGPLGRGAAGGQNGGPFGINYSVF